MINLHQFVLLLVFITGSNEGVLYYLDKSGEFSRLIREAEDSRLINFNGTKLIDLADISPDLLKESDILRNRIVLETTTDLSRLPDELLAMAPTDGSVLTLYRWFTGDPSEFNCSSMNDRPLDIQTMLPDEKLIPPSLRINYICLLTESTTDQRTLDGVPLRTDQVKLVMTLLNRSSLLYPDKGAENVHDNTYMNSTDPHVSMNSSQVKLAEIRSDRGNLHSVLPFLVTLHTREKQAKKGHFAGSAILLDREHMLIPSDTLMDAQEDVVNSGVNNVDNDKFLVHWPADPVINITERPNQWYIQHKGRNDCKQTFCHLTFYNANMTKFPGMPPSFYPKLSKSKTDPTDNCFMYTWTKWPEGEPLSRDLRKFVKFAVKRTTDCHFDRCEFRGTNNEHFCFVKALGSPIFCDGLLSYIALDTDHCLPTIRVVPVSAFPYSWKMGPHVSEHHDMPVGVKPIRERPIPRPVALEVKGGRPATLGGREGALSSIGRPPSTSSGPSASSGQASFGGQQTEN